MEMNVKLALVVAVISMLVSCSPTEAWYKQVAVPSYYSVGRASGLLSGIRRSPYTRRAEPDSPDSGETKNSVISDFSPHNFILKTMRMLFTTVGINNFSIEPVCIKDITPNLQSCELLQDVTGVFKCKADVFVSLDSSDCADA